MGSLCIEIGKIEKGLDCFDQVVDIRKSRFGHDHPETAESIHSVGLILLNMGYADESLKYFRAVAELSKNRLMQKREDGADPCISLYELGERLLKEKDGQDIALQCFDQILQLRKQPLTPDYAAVGDFLGNLASVLHEMERKEDSLKCLEHCEQIQRSQYGETSAELADTLYLVGRVCMELQHTEAAHQHLNEALDIKEILGEDTADIAAQLKLLEKGGRTDDAAAEQESYDDGGSSAVSEWISKSGNEDYSEQESAKEETYSVIEDGSESDQLTAADSAVEEITPSSPSVQPEANDEERGYYDDNELEDVRSYGEPSTGQSLNHDEDDGDYAADGVIPDMNDPLANVVSDVGEVLLDGGFEEEADDCFDMASDLRKKFIAEHDPELHDFLHRMGDVCLEIEALDTALDAFEEESILRKKHAPANATLGDAIHALGSVLLDLGDHERAMEAFLEEVDIRRKIGPDDIAVSEVLDTIGALYLESGDHVAALDSFSQVARIQKLLLGDEHEDVAETLYSIGLILLSLEDHEEALVAFREVAGIRQNTLGLRHELVGDALNVTGFLEHKTGNNEEALATLSKALDIRKHNEEYAKAADTLQQIGDIHREMRNFDLAIDCYQQCLKLSKWELGEEDEGIAEGYIALGNIQTVVGHHSDAGASYQAGFFIIMKLFGNTDDRVMPLLLKMGTARLKACDHDQAEENLLQFTRLRKEQGGNNDIDYVNALRIIGTLRYKIGDKDGAMEVWEEAFDTYTNNRLAYDHPRVGEKLRNLLDGVSPDEPPEREAGFANLFSNLTRKVDTPAPEISAKDVVDQAIFFSTRSLEDTKFGSNRSLRSLKDTNSITERSLASRSRRRLHDEGSLTSN